MTQLPAAPPAPFPLKDPRDEYGLAYVGGFPDDVGTEAILRRYWRIFYKHRWIILAAVGLCLAAALVVTLVMQPQYTSGVTLEISRETPKIVDMQQVDQAETTAPDMEFYQTQYALLKSRSLSQAVVRDLGLANNYLYLAGYEESRVDDFRSKPLKERLGLAIEKVNEDTSVTPVRGSSIVNVAFTSPDAGLSVQVANSIGQNFIASNLSRRFEAAAYARDFLQNRLRQVRTRLEDSERKAVQYAQQQGLIRIRTGTGDKAADQSLLASQLSELSTQLTAAHAQRAQAEAQYREGAAGSAAAQSLSSVTLSTLRPERAQLVGQLSKLQSDFGPDYPPIVALNSQIKELDKQISREESRVNSSVAQDLGGRFQQALATERTLQSKVDSLKAQLIGEEGRSIQYNILQRDVDTNRALYDALLQRFKEVGIAGGVGTNNVSIVDPAIPPERPSSPNLLLNLALGLILGLMIGAGAALLLEHLSESVILPSEFQTKLRVPLLGSTPGIGKRLLATRLLTQVRPGESAPTADERRTYVAHDPSLAEAYLSIVAALQFSTSHGAPSSLCVTSTQEQEGKTTTAVAIARALSSTGARVLLIDADMRRPSIHRTFELPDRRGLSDVLTGHAKFGDVLHETGEHGLTVMGAGKSPPSPAELLGGASFGQTVEEATRQFDHVIIDSPPLLGLADAPLISRAVEGTVFVIEAGRTRSSQARQALDRLAAVRAEIVGAVLTKLDSRSSGYGYGYGYNYSYGTA